MSYPAAKALPRVGNFAFSLSFLMRRGGWAESLGTAGVEEAIVDAIEAEVVSGLGF
jgi:hypothetical protein